MLSTTTTASSMMSPIATARPPREMRFRLSPASFSPANVPAMLSGMVAAAMAVIRSLPEEEQEDHDGKDAAENHCFTDRWLARRAPAHPDRIPNGSSPLPAAGAAWSRWLQ